MKTLKYLLVPIFLLAIVLFFYFKNYFFTKREFTVYKSDRFDICFMIDSSYKVDFLSDTELKYSGQKNKGHLKILKQDLDSTIKPQKINGFPAGYQKLKNLRIYEYKLNDEYILKDDFVFASKMPLNLVPFREQCDDIQKHYKKVINIFN